MAKVPLTAILSFYFTSIQMDEKVIIDCIGPSVLTITISGATHSVAIATDVIKISGGRGDHGLDFLPLIYDAAALGGRLNICDGAGKMIYCWRSAVVLQSIIEPDPVLPSTSSNRVESTTASLCTNDLSRMSTESTTTILTPGGSLSRDMTDSRDTTSHNSTEDSGFDPKTGQGYIDLEDYEVTDQSAPGGFTVAQKKFLVNSINKLLKLSYGEFFRQPANYLDPKLKKIDLRTMRSKLRDSLYLSVEDIKADFDIMVHGSEVGNGTYHQLTEQARRLRTAFEAYMSDFPGKSEESASKKKANERYVDDFPGKGKESAQRKRANEMNTSDFSGKDEDFIPRRKARMREPEATLAQNASSSPPRAAKTAMLGRKYPRDHW